MKIKLLLMASEWHLVIMIIIVYFFYLWHERVQHPNERIGIENLVVILFPVHQLQLVNTFFGLLHQ